MSSEKGKPSVKTRMIDESELPQILANCNLAPDNPMTPLLTAFASIITQQQTLLKYMSGQVNDLKRLTTGLLNIFDDTGLKLDIYSTMKTYVLEVPDISDGISRMNSFHTHGEKNYKYGDKIIIFVSDEENVQLTKKEIKWCGDELEPVIEGEQNVKERLREFLDKFQCRYLIWARSDVPILPEGSINGIVQPEVASRDVYENRIKILQPAYVYNVASSALHADEWMKVAHSIGYKPQFYDFSTEYRWDKYQKSIPRPKWH
ncbi:hypothetical protein Ddc_09867 [Ditylenchus destructor]|nr:hypothetical protein Ddc_09867 [Ditylenchus destructor]